ncbi:MAG: Fur family ferric uptake transcriptional regulator [Myxococcota bacterium]|jgi:Fur family ferric uptake transcriptional regulator
MPTDTAQQLQRFHAFLSGEGLKVTRQRQAIAEAFYGSGGHLSLQDLLDLARKAEPSIGYATVYRTMKLLADGGLATEHQFADGHARFEPAEEGEHHDHLICLTCGHILEFESDAIEQAQDRIAADYQMKVKSHRHEIYAECLRTNCVHRPSA